MRKMRTKVYVKANVENSEIIYSGIDYADFIKYLQRPIENLLLMKGDYWGNGHEFKFELLEGQREIEKLAKEDIYNFGDFCFVDYSEKGAVSLLNKQQVAEILYMAHLGETMTSPFFEPLHNRFAYLAHDDGWYCKLYCREMDEFMAVLNGKITSNINIPLPAVIQNRLKQSAMGGLLIDLEEIYDAKERVSLNIYKVGAYSNMGEVLNDWQQIKLNATSANTLSYSNNEWSIF